MSVIKGEHCKQVPFFWLLFAKEKEIWQISIPDKTGTHSTEASTKKFGNEFGAAVLFETTEQIIIPGTREMRVLPTLYNKLFFKINSKYIML